MAVVINGDIVEIAWSNPDLGSGFFFPIANTDSTLNLGGFRGNDQAVLDGAGRLMNQKNRMPWSASMETANDPLNTKELEAASALAASTAETVYTITHVSGVRYKGAGTILGNLEGNFNKGSFQLTLTGGGVLVQI